MGSAVPGRPPQIQTMFSSNSKKSSPPITSPPKPGDSGQSSSQASDISSNQGTSVGSCQVSSASAQDVLQQDGSVVHQPWQQQNTDLKLVSNETAVKTSTSASFSNITARDGENTVSTLTDMVSLEDCMLPSLPCPAKPLLKPSTLKDTCYILPENKVFVDKILPASDSMLTQSAAYPLDYFIGLHSLISAPTAHYPAYTPNYCGARLPLQHTGLKIPRWRYHLTGYEGAEIIQYLQYGFPLGLSDNPPPTLVSTLRNHGSSYQYFTHLDEFFSTVLERCEIAGPCSVPPFEEVHISPLMSAVKKPSSRRAVFDASFGEYSLNNGTPTDVYLNHTFSYDFPKVEDFKRYVLECGPGCYIYKRDLSRYYLQLPVDPVEYPLLCFIWRKYLFFFVALMFGLRHAGLQGQKVTTAVTWAHRRLGLEAEPPALYNSLNYSDDIGGCETTLERATEAFEKLGNLFADLGLRESTSKAHPPSTLMPYLGIMFNTITMRMSIPPEKVAEVREDISLWVKKSSASKKLLQQLLGKLLWVSKCVRFSRGFIGRLLSQLQQMHNLPDNKKVKLTEGSRKDIAWWERYLRRFNGVEMLYQTDPLGLSLDQLLETNALVNCGDAQMSGGGSYFGTEYWSRPFPAWLQGEGVPIHLKEFWVVVVSAWLWGEQWQGHMVYVFCDNTAVVQVLDKEKPRDPRMLDLLREFLYIVCTRKFTPIFRRIGTKENSTADYISRCHDSDMIAHHFQSNNLPMRTPITAPDCLFTLHSNW